jgi:hypothetical protein
MSATGAGADVIFPTSLASHKKPLVSIYTHYYKKSISSASLKIQWLPFLIVPRITFGEDIIFVKLMFISRSSRVQRGSEVVEILPETWNLLQGYVSGWYGAVKERRNESV